MLFYKKESFMNDMWFFYFIHYLFLFGYIIMFLKTKHSKVYMLFSPMLFSFVYLGISFTLGAYFIPLNMGWSGELYPNFIKIERLNWYTIFFFIADLILLAAWTFISSKGISRLRSETKFLWPKYNQSHFLIFFSIFLILNFFEPFQIFLGTLLYPLKLVSIIYVTLITINFKKSYKGLTYILILLIMLINHYHSKREIILVVFIIFFLESLYNGFNIKFKLSQVLKLIGIFFIAAYLIFAASILRGYGGYKLDNKLDALLLVPDYITQPYFKDAFVANFELNTVLGNTMICMDFIEKDRLPLQLGGTYLKVLLSPIPRSIWKNKPEGLILKYTYELNPEHKITGQSLPVVHYAEGFANFYWLGIIPIVLIMIVFEKMFWYVLICNHKTVFNWKLIFSIYVICILFQYIRGSGFDLFSLYVLFGSPLILIVQLLPRKKRN